MSSTRFFYFYDDGEYGYGWAICSPHDMPCKRTGQAIAAGRAQAALVHKSWHYAPDGEQGACMQNDSGYGAVVSISLGFCGLLVMLGIALKCLGMVQWPWRWVLLPLWVPATFTMFILLVCVVKVVVGALRARR